MVFQEGIKVAFQVDIMEAFHVDFKATFQINPNDFLYMGHIQLEIKEVINS